jgi:hypothetical protein
MYNHHYPPHGYPIPNHHHSPQYYQQYYHPPPGQQSPSHDQYVHLPADSAATNEINKVELKAGSRHDESDSPRTYGRISASGGQLDDSEVPVQQLAV